MSLVTHLDELRRHAHAVPRAPHASFQHVRDAQLAANLLDAFARGFVLHGGSPGDDTQSLGVQPAELRDQLLRQTVTQVLLLLVPT